MRLNIKPVLPTSYVLFVEQVFLSTRFCLDEVYSFPEIYSNSSTFNFHFEEGNLNDCLSHETYRTGIQFFCENG